MIVVYLVRPLITMFKMCLCRSLDFLLFLYCFDVDEALFHIIAIFIDSFTRDRRNTYYELCMNYESSILQYIY